jgi:hypothetical protein
MQYLSFRSLNNKITYFLLLFFITYSFSLADSIRQFSQDPWENDSPRQYKGHSDEISDSISNLWDNGTMVFTARTVFRDRQPDNRQDYAYGIDIFAQTGNYYGFSIGGSYMLTNPFFAEQMNQQPINIYIPSNKVNVISQAFLQYTFPGVFQITAGRIAMDTPWIKTTTNNPLTNATYQGAIANAQVTDSLFLTALYINAYKGIAQSEFSDNSMYTLSNDTTKATPIAGEAALDLTVGLGAEYSPRRDIQASLWGYIFQNYVSMLYADGGKTFEINDNQALVLNIQAAIQSDFATGGSVATNLDLGAPDSRMIGAKLTYQKDWFSFGAASNLVWGPSGSFKNGGMISPYTFNIANDPLYTTSFFSGMIEKGGGSAYKVFSAIKFLEEKLIFTPSFAFYEITNGANSNEFDFITRYYFKDPGIELGLVYGLAKTMGQGKWVSTIQLRASYTV